MGKIDRAAAAGASPEDFGLTDGLTQAELLKAVQRLVEQLRVLRDDVSMKTSMDHMVSRWMGVMTLYLAGELPPEVAVLVEAALREEPLLRAGYRGLFAAWQAPSAERDVPAEEVDAAFARFKGRKLKEG